MRSLLMCMVMAMAPASATATNVHDFFGQSFLIQTAPVYETVAVQGNAQAQGQCGQGHCNDGVRIQSQGQNEVRILRARPQTLFLQSRGFHDDVLLLQNRNFIGGGAVLTQSRQVRLLRRPSVVRQVERQGILGRRRVVTQTIR